MIKKVALFFVVVVLLLAGYIFSQYQAMNGWLDSALDINSSETVTVIIPKGCSVRGALNILHKKNLIDESKFIRFVGKIGKTVPAVQAGEYELSKSLSPLEMLKKLHSGKTKTYAFTIPEGFSVKDIGARLEQLGYAKSHELQTLRGNKKFLRSLGIPQLEGYLFPDTYKIPKAFSLKQIVKMMVRNQQKQFDDKMKKQAIARGLSRQQVLVIASIIEKESGGASEYPIVSSVIKNRLKIKMPLQMDPTVIYGIKNFNGNLTRKDLKTDHPWNTYTRSGLPPSPICNPGFGAIKAALFPATTAYLYFVAMNNGHHKFTSTLREHNNAVHKYQVLRHVGP